MSEQRKTTNWDNFQAVWTKRMFVLSLVLLGTVFTLQGIGVLTFPEISKQGQQTTVRVGGLRCDAPTWNFGLVDSIKNPRLSYEFVIVNESKETVPITKIHSTCGCMIAEGYDKELAPGKSTKVQVSVQLPPIPQRFQKDLAVQTDKGVLPLRVVGEIAANGNLFSTPAVVHFGAINVGEKYERTVKIFRHDLSPVEYQGIESNSTSVVYTATQTETDSSASLELIISAKADQTSVGHFEDTIRIITKNQDFPEFLLPVRGEVVGLQEEVQ